MARLHQTSVREELDRLKADFQRLESDQTLSGESKMLMRSMLTLLELICAIFLEKTARKTSRNSSIPSSQSNPDDSALAYSGSHGKGKNERSQLADNCRSVETQNTLSVTACDQCGEDLSRSIAHQHERRTKIDIVFEKTIEHTDAEIKHCPFCASTVKAPFHADLHGPLQYGNGLKATSSICSCAKWWR